MRHNNLVQKMKHAAGVLRGITPLAISGRIVSVSGLVVEVAGTLRPGICRRPVACCDGRDGASVRAEVAGFRDGLAQALPFGPLDGLGSWANRRAVVAHRRIARGVGWLAWAGWWIRWGARWTGKARCRSGPPLARSAPCRRRPRAAPVSAIASPLGVRALDLFTTCRLGQRLGLFSGSGVGKSTLFAMLARAAVCDVAVIALVGERGREVREFLEDDLGPDGLARSVVVVATSDAPPVLRRRAAYTAMTVAEHFRDQGKSVLFMMDSVTRFCLAAREIGLSAGEPPSTRGYPPSVFAELPRLLERAGPGEDKGPGATGFITALFTVLVEGDDTNEPVADAVRGILDGHVLLDRRIAEAGRYPPVDVLRSLSRAAQGCLTEEEMALTRRARGIVALQTEMADLVRMGAYRAGTDPAVDEALRAWPADRGIVAAGPRGADRTAGGVPDVAGCAGARRRLLDRPRTGPGRRQFVTGAIEWV